MGGHCSQKLCPGGDRTPLRGATDLRINRDQQLYRKDPIARAARFPGLLIFSAGVAGPELQ